MNTSTLRNWGGAVAVSLPKKVLAVLGLRAGSQVEVKVEDGMIILSPTQRRRTLLQLEKEQRALERKLGSKTTDADWVSEGAKGREAL